MKEMGEIEVLDGGSTYVDNSVLWPVLGGRWQSTDGRRHIILGEDIGITFLSEGKTVLSCELYFTYLLPAENAQTELVPKTKVLRREDETSPCEVLYLCHETSANGNGTIRMDLELSDGGAETIIFRKIQE